MAREQIQIHGAEAIVRTHEVVLPFQGQVAQNNRSKLSKSDEASDGLVIFRLESICGFEAGAIGIGLAGVANSSERRHSQQRCASPDRQSRSCLPVLRPYVLPEYKVPHSAAAPDLYSAQVECSLHGQ